MRWHRFLFVLLIVAARAACAAPTPPAIDAVSYVLLDPRSGQVLAERQPDAHADPASLTKLMTSLVTFRALRAGTLGLDDPVSMSENACRTDGPRSFLQAGSQVRVEDLIRGMIVQSANDAAIALAERIGGTEEGFAALMNEEAKRLGLTNTLFDNATGLPGTGSGHYSSARDIALIAHTLITEFPEYYHWFSQREFTYNGITQHNHNALLWQDEQADGLEAGDPDDATYCLAASARRDDMRLISVVMGATSDKARLADGRALLDYGFQSFETHRIYAADAEIARVKVAKGNADEVPLGLASDLYLTIPRGQYGDLVPTVDVPAQIVAPLPSHADIGVMRIALGDQVLVERPVQTLSPVAPGSLWRRVVDAVTLLFE